MDRLDTLRAEQPVLWAVVCGATSMLKIGILTKMTPKQVDQELTALKEQGLVKFYMNKAWMLDKNHSSYEANSEAAKLTALIEARWIAHSTPEAVSEIAGIMSRASRDAIKAEQKTMSAADKEAERMILTDKQQAAWNKIKGWLEDQGRDGEPFTTREAAKAQGFDKAGFTKSQLLAMLRKGRLRHIEGRPEKWVLVGYSQP
ncbi:hypothetical protein SEA_HUWBERT_108 [Microbacterium phage Huwbert]|nr:hypothetical protein SEA_HUWBERT_108 [Microbacterium phage Huwbert]